MIRGIERACEKTPHLQGAFQAELAKARTIFAQALNPKAAEKIHSWHAPETECIAKGKGHKKYEFGCKASHRPMPGRAANRQCAGRRCPQQ
jgi:transposase, IS5 family